MGLALAEGEQARTADVPIGAVVVDADGQVIGRGHNEREATGDPTAHAEVLAIREAAEHVGEWRLTGCTLVVTLEPCTMCAGAIVLSRLDRLVFAAYDEKAGAVGLALGRRPGPQAEPPARGRGRCDGRRGGCAAPRFLHRAQVLIASAAVACPSGRRSAPRKRVKGIPLPRVQIPPPPPTTPGWS